MHDPANGLRRIHLLGTRVHRGKRKRTGASNPALHSSGPGPRHFETSAPKRRRNPMTISERTPHVSVVQLVEVHEDRRLPNALCALRPSGALLC
jgi:hypothetical protein